MKKQIIPFLKSEIGTILVFLLSNLILILFYSIEVEHQVEIFYPLMLSLFVLFLYEGYRFYRYIKKSNELERMIHTPGYDCKESDAYVVKVNQKINQLHSSYLLHMNEMNQKKQKHERFSSALVHNMKTPIAVSSLVLQRLERQEISCKEATKTLEEENQKLLTELNNVLELQRFEEAINDYQPKSINLAEQVKELINGNKSLFIQNHVFPKLECEEQECVAIVDKKWNQVMLQQFLSNAVKYSHSINYQKESKFITFRIQKIKIENKVYSQLRIQDQGIGIPEYDLPNVWEAFYTGDNGRKQYNSSGIGLFLCQQIAALLQAEISIQSKVGTGTTITISYLTKL